HVPPCSAVFRLPNNSSPHICRTTSVSAPFVAAAAAYADGPSTRGLQTKRSGPRAICACSAEAKRRSGSSAARLGTAQFTLTASRPCRVVPDDRREAHHEDHARVADDGVDAAVQCRSYRLTLGTLAR